MVRWVVMLFAAVFSCAILAQEAEVRAGGGGGGGTTFTDPSGVLTVTMNSSVREDSSQWIQVQSTQDLGLGSISLCSETAVWSTLQIYVGVWSNYVDFPMPYGLTGSGFYFQVSTVSTSVRTAAFEIRPQPTITDFAPQTAAVGQEVVVYGYGFDAFNCVNLSAQNGDNYYYTGDIPAQMWDDGTIHFTVPQSMFFRQGVNGLVGQVPLDSLKEVSLQLYAGSDGWNAAPVVLKIVTGNVNIALSLNSDGSYVFAMGRDSLYYTLACDNVDEYTLSLVRTAGTKIVVPLGTFQGYTDFSQGVWAIPADIAPGTYVLMIDSGNRSASTAEITIKAPLVAPQIVTLTVPASPVGLEIKFDEGGDGTPDIVNVARERFRYSSSTDSRGITILKVYDLQNSRFPANLKERLTKH